MATGSSCRKKNVLNEKPFGSFTRATNKTLTIAEYANETQLTHILCVD